MKKMILLGVMFALTLGLQARVTCKSLSSCSEACMHLENGVYQLDRDKDGIPCENLCHSPCKKKKKEKKKGKGKK